MTVKFPVEAGQIMLFARACGDANKVYCDEDYAAQSEAGSIIAPPTFVQSSAQYDPDYHLRPKIGQPWFGSGATASGTASSESSKEDSNTGGVLHAEQHYHYHRHPRPGDVLTLEQLPGKTWEKQGKRGGTLKFTEAITEYRDQAGELVVTARSVGVQTSQVVE